MTHTILLQIPLGMTLLMLTTTFLIRLNGRPPKEPSKRFRSTKGQLVNGKKIATKLGLGEEIDNINGENHGKRDDCVTAVFGSWLRNASGMPHADKYPKSWEGLIRLLKDSDLTELANKVTEAIYSPENEVAKTLKD